MVFTLEFGLWEVIIAAVASFILGWLWHSKALFGDLWLKLSGITPKQIEQAKKKGMAGPMIASFIATLVTAATLAGFLNYYGSDIITGLSLGFFIWLGFIATTTINSVLWEGKSMKLWTLKNAHLLVNLLVMGVIVALV